MPDPAPLDLVAPGVNDARSRAFAGALGALLGEFAPSALMIQDAWSAPSALLPAMVIEAGLADFVSDGMREAHLRALIAAAPAIHAMSGTIAGVRRALEAVGIAMQWTQWWQDEPPGPHDTHRVFLFADDVLISDEGMLSAANQAAARKLIDATKRWSQEVAIQYGVRAAGTACAGAIGRTHVVAVAHPQLLEPPVLQAAAYAGATAATSITVTAHRKAA